MRNADVFDRTLIADQFRMTAATPDRLVMTALSTSQHDIWIIQLSLLLPLSVSRVNAQHAENSKEHNGISDQLYSGYL